MPLFEAFFIYNDFNMNENRFISASEIGLYVFCPRAWALNQLDFESDHQWELEEGQKFHEEVGKQEIAKKQEMNPQQIRLKRIDHIFTIIIIFVFFCILSIIIRLFLQ